MAEYRQRPRLYAAIRGHWVRKGHAAPVQSYEFSCAPHINVTCRGQLSSQDCCCSRSENKPHSAAPDDGKRKGRFRFALAFLCFNFLVSAAGSVILAKFA